MSARVAVLMGSLSDLPVMAECVRVLRDYAITADVRVLSAHRSPDAAADFAKRAEDDGFALIIAGAGGAAHLAGVMAAHTVLPVIGVPLEGSPLGGFDALLSTVQMPPGVPVATVGVGSMGARNAGHLAAGILGVADPDLRERVRARRKQQAQDVLGSSARVAEKLQELLGS